MNSDLIYPFCHFLDVQSYGSYGYIRGYKLDLRLAKYVRKVLQKYPEATEHFLAQYFLKAFLENPHNSLLRDILLAYLDKVAFYTAVSICKQYAVLNPSFGDCFAIAREQLLNLEKLLGSYDFSSSSVKHYAGLRLKSATLAAMKELQKQRYRSTNWAILKNRSLKQFQNVFQQAGFSSQRCDLYLAIIEAFQDNYKGEKQNGRFLPPNAEELQAIANALPKPLSESQILTLLTQISEMARQQNRIQLVSLDKQDYMLENLTDEPEYTPFEELLPKLSQVLENILLTLPPSSQNLLATYYGNVLNQTQIAKQLGVKPYQVSRQLQRLRRPLLKGVEIWAKTELKKTLDSETKAKIDGFIGEWLKEYYQGYGYLQAA